MATCYNLHDGNLELFRSELLFICLLLFEAGVNNLPNCGNLYVCLVKISPIRRFDMINILD